MTPRFRIWAAGYKPPRYIAPSELTLYGAHDLGEALAIVTDQPGTYTLEQWTGLTDVAGKPVFEGDIIAFTIKGITHGPDPDPVPNAQVWYCAEDAMWAFGKYPHSHNGEFRYHWWYSMADRVDRATLRVLGNVHEHPELLTTHPVIT